MNYTSFEKLRQETQLVEANRGLKMIWYLQAEGFYTFTANYLDYSQLFEVCNKYMPRGWQIQLSMDGSIIASFMVQEQDLVLKIEKQRNGRESVRVLSS